MDENEIARIVVDRCLKIHRTLGPGLLESVYEELLSYELMKSGLKCDRQVGIPVVYEDIRMDLGFRADVGACPASYAQPPLHNIVYVVNSLRHVIESNS